ncbi:hypothetical protein [Anabaena sp. CCY 9910]|uniref:hypothetical protein n=1 Tax=Anabaena sp. CCY 9910 TaxID=3103870 RepID=UPI0039E19A92
MQKHKFSFTLALALILSIYSLGTPRSVNAGTANITGGSEDSSSSSGDSFNPASYQSSPEIAPGVNVEFSRNGDLTISREIQERLNATIANTFSQTPPENTTVANFIAILKGDSKAEEAANQLQSSLGNSGASASSIQTLMGALFCLAGNTSTSESCAFSSNLVVDSETDQNKDFLNVDINRLSAAINAYNKIVRESSPQVLQQLAKDENFREIGNLLKQLRTALSQS